MRHDGRVVHDVATCPQADEERQYEIIDERVVGQRHEQAAPKSIDAAVRPEQRVQTSVHLFQERLVSPVQAVDVLACRRIGEDEPTDDNAYGRVAEPWDKAAQGV